MAEALAWLAALAAFGVCGLLAVVGMTRWRLGRRNRVDPREPSPAPVRWLSSPSPAAKMHRRLQSLVRVGTSAATVDESATAEITRLASALDHQLVLASGLASSPRRKELHRIDGEVRRLEELTGRLTRPTAGALGDDAMGALAALAEARDEVEAIEKGPEPQQG